MRRPVVLLILGASTAGLLAGCGSKSWVGDVTSMPSSTSRFCVGTADAEGSCFTIASARMLAHVKYGDCVHVTFDDNPTGAAAPERLTGVNEASGQCPTISVVHSEAVLPNVVGLDQQLAIQRLQAAGFQTVNVGALGSTRRLRVHTQWPEPGRLIPTSTSIDLVSK